MPKQLEFLGVSGWGGRRKGAGRPNRSGLNSHLQRPRVNANTPLHLTFKVRAGVVDLQNRDFHRKFRHAIKRVQSLHLSINHYSILSSHIHLIVEASNNSALSRGTKSLGGRLGRWLRKMSLGKGPVFKERFHLHALKTPREVKNALRYVLQNESKHKGFIAYLDEFSSACYFKHWDKLLDLDKETFLFNGLKRHTASPPDCLAPAESWLLEVGWLRAA